MPRSRSIPNAIGERAAASITSICRGSMAGNVSAVARSEMIAHCRRQAMATVGSARPLSRGMQRTMP